MEWVETTGKTLEEAKDLALDQLGIVADDAEFEVLEEPRTGLFGRVRGAARVRARVRPAAVRPKQDRRGRRRDDAKAPTNSGSGDNLDTVAADAEETRRDGGSEGGRTERSGSQRRPTKPRREGAAGARSSQSGDTMSNEQHAGGEPERPRRDAVALPVDPEQVAHVRDAAVSFSDGLVGAFGLDGTSSATIDGNEIDVRIDPTGAGDDGAAHGLGLLIGPSGRTLLAIQDLARVAAQRRLGDHETRLRIDVAGYREKRRVALERFARSVADLVKESGIARSLDPMPSADRKVVHDTLASIDGVSSRSEGEDPNRCIIVIPA